MKKFTFRAAALTFALLIALCAVAYALTGGWGVGDYLQNRYGRDIPEGFVSDYTQSCTQTVDGVTFTIRDAYIDHNDLCAIVTVAQEDGGDAVFLMADLSPSDQMSNLYLDGREDARTIAQYAEETGVPVREVNVWFDQEDAYLGGGMDVWREEDGTTAAALTIPGISMQNGGAALIWRVQVLGDNGEATRGDVEILLPAVTQTKKVMDIGKPVEGLNLTLDQITLYTGALGTRAEIAFSVPETVTEEERAYVGDCVWFELIDPATGERVPEGASLTGCVTATGDSSYLQTGDSISASWQGDTLILRAYDCWEKTRFGSVEVSLR